MFEDKEVAHAVSDLMLEIGEKLDASVAQVQQRCSAAEFERYREVVGRVMGDLLLEVMNPLYLKHPEFKPEGLDDFDDEDE